MHSRVQAYLIYIIMAELAVFKAVVHRPDTQPENVVVPLRRVGAESKNFARYSQPAHSPPAQTEFGVVGEHLTDASLGTFKSKCGSSGESNRSWW
jgi:hypothetical protein